MPYVALVLIGIWLPQRKYIFVLAIISTLLTIIGYLFSPPGGEYWVVLLNRGLALFAIWVTAILLVSRSRHEEESIQAGDMIKISHDILLDALESVPTMMALYDSEDRFVLCNQEYKKSLYKIEDMLVPGMTFQEISYAGAKRGLVKGYEENPEEWVRIRTERLHNPTAPVLHQQQDGRWVLTADHKVSNGSTFITCTDVSDIINAEAALRETESRFRKSQSHANIGTWEWNIQDGALFWSERIMPLFGYEPGSVETTYDNFVAAIHPDDRDKVANAVQRCIEDHEVYDIEHRVVWADGTVHWLHEKGDVQYSESGAPLKMLGAVWDITDSKNAEHDLREALIKADVASRAKSDLLANMSHELRTPLNAIIGFSESIMEQTLGPIENKKYSEYIGDIHYSGQHLLDLINDILDVSAIEAGSLKLYEENISVAGIVDSATHMLRPRADHAQVTITSKIDKKIPMIYADERRVKQVLINLLSNAVKFTPKGGNITIRGDVIDNGDLSIEVIDNGVGMDEEDATLALSRFGQVDSGLNRKNEGTGLGLPLTQGLMELHGGTLEIESEKNQGTIITTTFPKERIV